MKKYKSKPHRQNLWYGGKPDFKTAVMSQILQLAQSCNYEEGHSRQVTRLSLQLFDRLKRLHGLGKEERGWLHSGSLLHDIGWIKGQKRHHKTSRDIILVSPMLAFRKEERTIIGLICRYHRGALPKNSHKYFSNFNLQLKNVIRKLAALLRVADGLDWRHLSLVKDIKCKILPKRVIFQLKVKNFSEEDMTKALEKADLFEQVFGKKLTLSF